MSTTETAARGAAWTIIASLLSRGLGLVATLILIRFVSPEDYGEVAAATVVVFTVNYATTLGVGVYVIAKRDATREDMFHATVIHVTLGVVALLALWVLRKPLSPLFDTPNMYRYVPGLAAAAFIDRLAFMPERVLIRALRFRLISLLRAAGEVAFVVAALGTAWRGWGGMSIVVANVVRSGLRGSAFVASVSWRDWLQVVALRWAVVRKIASYGFTVTLTSIADYAATRWDNLLVSRFFGPAVMATYNLAYNLADIPAVHIGEQIADVMGASFAHMSPEERRSTLLRSFGVIGLVTFPLALGIGVIAPSLADLFLNEKWAGAAPMLLLLSALSLSRPIFGVLASFLRGRGGAAHPGGLGMDHARGSHGIHLDVRSNLAALDLCGGGLHVRAAFSGPDVRGPEELGHSVHEVSPRAGASAPRDAADGRRRRWRAFRVATRGSPVPGRDSRVPDRGGHPGLRRRCLHHRPGARQ